MLRKRLQSLAAALLAGAAFLGANSAAQAAITIAISTDGGATFTTSSGAENATLFTAAPVAIAGGGSISVTARTNQPIGADFATVSQTQINATGGTAAQLVALVVRVSDIDFALPAGVSLLSSSFSMSLDGGSAPNPTASIGSFQSVADFNNGVLFGGLPGVPQSAPVGSFATTGLQVVTVTPIQNVTGSSSGNATVATVSAAPFSLSNEFRFVNAGGLTLLAIPGGGAAFQFTGTTQLTAVPAPAGVVLALAGLPVLGFGWLRRRNKAKASA